MAKKAKKKVVKAKTAQPILPRKLSSLIKVALKDIRRAENTPGYLVRMNTWHDPDEVVCRIGDADGGIELDRKPICSVCAAGSVIAFSLKGDPTKELDPDDFPRNRDQLNACDDLRSGRVTAAAERLGVISDMAFDADEGSADRKRYDKLAAIDNRTLIPDYNFKNPEPFHAAMKKLEAKLRKAGF